MNVMSENFNYLVDDDVNNDLHVGLGRGSLGLLENDNDNGHGEGNLELNNPNDLLHLMVMMP
jgi:hypothetical protein